MVGIIRIPAKIIKMNVPTVRPAQLLEPPPECNETANHVRIVL
jgi:hypothetical protein